jgi:signal transduction histidine kinase
LRSKVRIKSRDEIGELAASFNRMSEAIEQREGELRSQQETLKETNSQLAAASRHKSQFLANMSHDLRTPLNAILGFSGILLNPPLGTVSEAEQREFLGNIVASGKHLLDLVNQVLNLAKIEANLLTFSHDRISVPEMIESVRQIFELLAREKQISIATLIDPTLTTITTDKTRFREILDNLIGNAIKFTPRSGAVTIRAGRTGEWVKFSVSDTGIGIKPEDCERIFEEFVQGEISAERRSEGTGLGLTLTKKYVELQGGRIWLESALGRGSTFAFVLPLRVVEEPNAAAKAPTI